jgi:hypothetical protein
MKSDITKTSDTDPSHEILMLVKYATERWKQSY